MLQESDVKPFSERQDDVLHSTLQKINSQDLKKLFEQERTITSLVVATPFDFNIFFFLVTGSTQLRRGLTQQTGGSLLDDSQWHDVIIRRNHTKVTLVVDRLETHFETNGLFYRLNLDKKVRNLWIWRYIMGYYYKTAMLIMNLKCT